MLVLAVAVHHLAVAEVEEELKVIVRVLRQPAVRERVTVPHVMVVFVTSQIGRETTENNSVLVTQGKKFVPPVHSME